MHLRLRNTSCSFAEFAVAELSVNLLCPALQMEMIKKELRYISSVSDGSREM